MIMEMIIKLMCTVIKKKHFPGQLADPILISGF